MMLNSSMSLSIRLAVDAVVEHYDLFNIEL
jgi:hypothetical protein